MKELVLSSVQWHSGGIPGGGHCPGGKFLGGPGGSCHGV